MDPATTLPSPASPGPWRSPSTPTPIAALRSLSDDELLRRVVDLTGRSRRVEADLVAHLAEVDARRLYARFAHPSMFAYCTEALHLSEAEAYLRIAAARASREHPVLLDMLRDGRLHLTAISLLAPHLTPANRDALLARATHESRRHVEELVAELAPRPEARSLIRRLPGPGQRTARRTAGLSGPGSGAGLGDGDGLESHGEPAPRLCSNGVGALLPHLDPGTPSGAGGGGNALDGPGDALAPQPPSALPMTPPPPFRSRPASIEPFAPARYKVQFTASAELREKLERLRALMRHAVPDGDLALLIDAAVSEKLERLEARRFGRRTRNHANAQSHTTTHGERGPAVPAALAAAAAPASSGVCDAAGPRPRSRHVPAAVRRAVFERDGGRCRYTDENKRRCSAREGLEIHHRHPFSHGGGCALGDLSLVCRSHNQRLAEHDFGRAAMERHRRRGGLQADPPLARRGREGRPQADPGAASR